MQKLNPPVGPVWQDISTKLANAGIIFDDARFHFRKKMSIQHGAKDECSRVQYDQSITNEHEGRELFDALREIIIEKFGEPHREDSDDDGCTVWKVDDTALSIKLFHCGDNRRLEISCASSGPIYDLLRPVEKSESE